MGDVDDLGEAAAVHRWTDARWDWFLRVWEASVSEASLEALKAQLAQLTTIDPTT